MWVWLLICAALAAFVIGFYFWSLVVLHQQKKAWATYANKSGLAYESGAFTAPPNIQGQINGFTVKLYTDAQKTNDIRGQRFVTAIDIELGQAMPTGAVIGTPETKAFAESLVFDQTFTPDHPDWKKSYVISTRNTDALKAYLTKERLVTLCKLMTIKNATVLYFFDELESVLHIETTKPLADAPQLENIMSQLVKACNKLALTDTEQSEIPKAPPAEDSQKEGQETEAEKKDTAKGGKTIESEETPPTPDDNESDDNEPSQQQDTDESSAP